MSARKTFPVSYLRGLGKVQDPSTLTFLIHWYFLTRGYFLYSRDSTVLKRIVLRPGRPDIMALLCEPQVRQLISRYEFIVLRNAYSLHFCIQIYTSMALGSK